MHGGDGLARHQPDHDTANQARARRRGNAIEVAKAGACVLHGLGDEPVEVFDMRARRDFRHHAAIGSVFVDLRQNEIGVDTPGLVDDGNGRLVATRFDTQDQHYPCFTS